MNAASLPGVPLPRGRADVDLLLRALQDPASMLALDCGQWDLLVRAARRAKLLATLHARLVRSQLGSPRVQEPMRHLQGAHALYLHRRRMADFVLSGLESVLGACGMPVLLLKGTAYTTQQLPLSDGRIFADVDILVPRQRLDEAEGLLRAAGWTSTVTDAYDVNYYRRWSHELPPMKHPSHALTLDVHHTLLPVTGRVKVDPGPLLERSIVVSATPWRVLSPADQVLHASLHLFQDSDCVDRLRDLVDIDALVRSFGDDAAFWPQLIDVVQRSPGAGRSLWYALRYGRSWLCTPVPPKAALALEALAPPAAITAVMDRAIGSVFFGPHPDARSSHPAPGWSLVLQMRAMLLRMPPHLLAYHAAAKLLRARQRH